MTYRQRYRLLRRRYPHHGRIISATFAHTMRDILDWERLSEELRQEILVELRDEVEQMTTCPGGPECPWFDYDSELRHHVDECGIFIGR